MHNQAPRIHLTFVILCLAGLFAAFVLMNKDMNIRVKRACAPIVWISSVTYSTIRLFEDKNKAGLVILKNFNQVYESCQYSAWDLLYGDSFDQRLKKFLR